MKMSEPRCLAGPPSRNHRNAWGGPKIRLEASLEWSLVSWGARPRFGTAHTGLQALYKRDRAVCALTCKRPRVSYFSRYSVGNSGRRSMARALLYFGSDNRRASVSNRKPAAAGELGYWAACGRVMETRFPYAAARPSSQCLG